MPLSVVGRGVGAEKYSDAVMIESKPVELKFAISPWLASSDSCGAFCCCLLLQLRLLQLSLGANLLERIVLVRAISLDGLDLVEDEG